MIEVVRDVSRVLMLLPQAVSERLAEAVDIVAAETDQVGTLIKYSQVAS